MTTFRTVFILAVLAAVVGAAPAGAAPRRADLTATRLAGLPTGSLRSGAAVRVRATVKNRGRRTSRRSKLAFYITADRKLSPRDTRAGRARVGRVRAGRSRVVRARLTLRAPDSRASWYLLGCADATHVVRESNERNNCRVWPLRLTSGTGPSGPPTAGQPGPPSAPGDQQPRLPVRGAFYYPWFPEAWNQQGMNPFTKYHPSLGFYDSSSPSVIDAHIRAMDYGGIQVAISSWWGQGLPTDVRVPALLARTAALGSPLRWALYYEHESETDPSVAQIAADLTHIRDAYGTQPAYFRIDGRPVVFVYADPADACGMADRWRAANAAVGMYVVLKVFTGFHACASQPDGWHQYAPASAADSQTGYSYTISPGFYKASEATPRLARDPVRWSQNVRDMVASQAPFQLVTSFSEWGEGTPVESATEWASPSGYGTYLDALHANGATP